MASNKRAARTGQNHPKPVRGQHLLVKGLEFDHVVITPEACKTKFDWYVALTRATRSVRVLAPQGTMVTRADSIAAGNCSAGTDSFIEQFRGQLDGRAAVSGEELLQLRNDTHTRAALSAAVMKGALGEKVEHRERVTKYHRRRLRKFSGPQKNGHPKDLYDKHT